MVSVLRFTQCWKVVKRNGSLQLQTRWRVVRRPSNAGGIWNALISSSPRTSIERRHGRHSSRDVRLSKTFTVNEAVRIEAAG